MSNESCVGCGAQAPLHPWRGRTVAGDEHPVCARCHARPKPGMKYHYFSSNAPADKRGAALSQTPPPAGPLNAVRWEVTAYLAPDRDEAQLLDAVQQAFGAAIEDEAGITGHKHWTPRQPVARYTFSKVQIVDGVPSVWDQPLTPTGVKDQLRQDPLRSRVLGLERMIGTALTSLITRPSDRVVVEGFPFYVKES